MRFLVVPLLAVHLACWNCPSQMVPTDSSHTPGDPGSVTVTVAGQKVGYDFALVTRSIVQMAASSTSGDQISLGCLDAPAQGLPANFPHVPGTYSLSDLCASIVVQVTVNGKSLRYSFPTPLQGTLRVVSGSGKLTLDDKPANGDTGQYDWVLDVPETTLQPADAASPAVTLAVSALESRSGIDWRSHSTCD